MRKFIVLSVAIAATFALAGCDTLDGDWTYSDTSSWSNGWSASSGDNRSHEQQLRDEAWWDDYHRAN